MTGGVAGPPEPPTPHELFAQAEAETATDRERGDRYRELMKEHGYLVPRCAGYIGNTFGPQCELSRGHKGKHARVVHNYGV